MASRGTLYVARAMALGGADVRPGHQLNPAGNRSKAMENEGKALGESV